MTGARRLLAAAPPLVLAAGGAVAVTWPLAAHLHDHVVVPRFFLGRGALPTSPDTYLHLWILAWVHHALVTGARLFDANVMYPAAGTLAGSEHMLGHWPLHGPVYGLTGNPVLAYDWVLLSSFAVNALAAWALVRRWTGYAPAALVGAAVYAWAPLRFATPDTVQHLNVAYLPLAVLFADRWRHERRARHLLAAAVLVAWQALCSYYLAYAAAVAVVVLGAAAWGAGGPAARAEGGALLGAGVAGLVPTAVLALPYLGRRAVGTVPAYDDIWLRAASAAPSWFVSPDMPLFAGWLPLALAALGLATAPRLLGAFRTLFLVGLGAVAVLLVLGPTATLGGVDVPLPYRLLHALVPGFSSLRYPYRFGVLSTMVLAVLAGAGFSAFARHAGRAGWAAAAAVVAVVGVEYRQAPLALVATDVADPPAAYRWLARHGAGRPLLEWPMPPPGDLRAGYAQARAMALGTHHWLPLANGYTAYPPPSFDVVQQLAARLPEAESLATLVDVSGVRLLLLHRDRLPPAARPAWERWLADGGCGARADHGRDVVCELPPPRRDLRAALVAANAAAPRETFAGLPLAPLPGGARARLEVPAPGALHAGLVAALPVVVANEGDAPWPGLAPLVPGVVTLRHRWRGAADGAFAAQPLLCDVPPGGRCTVVVALAAPRAPGRHALEIGVVQHGAGPIPLAEGPLRVVAVDVVATRRGAR
jgi:hypothetical protein